MVLEFIQPIIIIVIIIAFTVIVNAWIIGSADKTFFELLVKQPRFVDKPNATLADYSFQGFTTNDNDNDPNNNSDKKLLATYNSLRYVSFLLMPIAVLIGMMIFLGEQFGIQRKGQALEIISNSFFYIIILLFFPLLWDIVAAGVEALDVYIMNPGNPSPDAAAARAKDLFIKLGGVNTEVDMGKVFTDLGNAVIGNNQGLTQMFHDLMTAVFRAFMAAMIFLTMFIVGTMRIVMTATIIVGLPVILVIRLIPWIRKPADRLLDTFYGLVVATIISSIVVVAGTAYLDTMPKDTLEQNFQASVAAIGVVLLAVLMPVMLSPMLGSIITSVTGMATTALAAGVTAAGAGVAGAARGASAMLGGGGAGQAMAAGMSGGGGPGGGGIGASLAKAAMSGMGSSGKAMMKGFGDLAGQATGSVAGGVAGKAMSDKMAAAVAEAKREAATESVLKGVGSAPVSFEKPALPVDYKEPERKLPETGIRPTIYGDEQKQYASDIKDLDNAYLDNTNPGGEYVVPGMKALAVEPGMSVYQPEPVPMTAGKKIIAAAKGAAIGSLAGTASGLLSGNAMISSSHGMGDFKSAGKHIFDALDINNDGKIDVKDFEEGVGQIKEKLVGIKNKLIARLNGEEQKAAKVQKESTGKKDLAKRSSEGKTHD